MQLSTLGDILQWAETRFMDAQLYFGHGTDNAWDEAVALARHVLDLPADPDSAVIDYKLSSSEKKQLMALVEVRIEKRIPAPYLINEAWFAGHKFYIDERAIIPRSPMGELINNGFQPWQGNRSINRILDLCTGSACMAIASAYVFENAKIDAIDISEDVLEVARKNVSLHKFEDRITLIQSDLFSACPLSAYDVIISNPPYVSRKEMQGLPKEYQFEPTLALAAGEDGLDIVKKILSDAPQYLADPGLLFVEVGNSEEELQKQYPELPFSWLTFEEGGQGVFLLTAEDQKWQNF